MNDDPGARSRMFRGPCDLGDWDSNMTRDICNSREDTRLHRAIARILELDKCSPEARTRDLRRFVVASYGRAALWVNMGCAQVKETHVCAWRVMTSCPFMNAGTSFTGMIGQEPALLSSAQASAFSGLWVRLRSPLFITCSPHSIFLEDMIQPQVQHNTRPPVEVDAGLFFN